MSVITVDIAKLVAEGKSVEEIQAIVAAEIAKIEAAKTPTLAEVGARVANGDITTKDLIVIALAYATAKVPELAEMGELTLTGEELTELADAIDIGIEQGVEQIKGLLALADIMGVDPKDVITSQFKGTGAKPGSNSAISTAEAEAILASLRQSFQAGKN